MRKQLEQAINQVHTQQKVISSSQEFVKQVFSSHATEIFNVGKEPKNRYALLPPPTGGKNTTVFLLLNSAQ